MDTQLEAIVVLTGAGISAESGLNTFRGSDGLWENHSVYDVATPEAFAQNPELVQRFYNERRRQLQSAQIVPNRAHLALAQLEQEFSGKVTVVTQNIDDLHERAGSKRIIHMHGKLLEVRCVHTGEVHHWREDVTEASLCPCCQSKGSLRPNVVWFGEMPMQMEPVLSALAECDLFMAIGTSGNVYPAAGFAAEVRQHGRAHTVELNLEPSQTNSDFAEAVYGKASEVVPKYVERILPQQQAGGSW